MFCRYVPNDVRLPYDRKHPGRRVSCRWRVQPTTTTRYNAAGQPLSSVQKQLISQLSGTLESKSVLVSERGLTSTQWTVYSGGTKRVQYSTAPGSAITAETVTVDVVALSQKDTAGITTTATRPQAIQKDGTWYTYGWDLTKNICELYGQHGYIHTKCK